jgi:hypothetical protein
MQGKETVGVLPLRCGLFGYARKRSTTVYTLVGLRQSLVSVGVNTVNYEFNCGPANYARKPPFSGGWTRWKAGPQAGLPAPRIFP